MNPITTLTARAVDSLFVAVAVALILADAVINIATDRKTS